MRKQIAGLMLTLMSALAAHGAVARDIAPDALLREVTAEVTAVLRQDAKARAGEPAALAELVEARILPHFDFAHMTRLAMARHWQAATTEQQLALTAEFKTLLVRTYATALSGYRDQKITFRPLRMSAADTEVTVNSLVQLAGTEPLTIDYDLQRTEAGWKVYNIRIASVSLITAYRDTFASRIRETGIDGLIKSLADRNRQSRTGARPA